MAKWTTASMTLTMSGATMRAASTREPTVVWVSAHRHRWAGRRWTGSARGFRDRSQAAITPVNEPWHPNYALRHPKPTMSIVLVAISDVEPRESMMKTFEQALVGHDVVFIVGTGVSAGISGGAATATWLGLIRSGAERAQLLDSMLPPKWRTVVDDLLELGTSDSLVQAAGMVAKAIKKIGDHAYGAWLAEDVGQLELVDTAAAKALVGFPFPILTTNYDTLLEKASGRSSTDWMDIEGFQKVVTRGSDAIGHLHGKWDRPASVVLSEANYTQLSASDSFLALERAVSALKTIVYVGFGAGLADPNFSSLLAWHREKFPNSSVTHYRLCRKEEYDALVQQHADENVVPVSYGTVYADLGPFLQARIPNLAELAINEAGLARDVVQEARDILRDSMSSESVLAEMGLPGTIVRTDLIVTPVLLPVPHARFVRERIESGNKAAISQLDGYAEVNSHDFFVVVGDEGSGLSTAIRWLAVQSSEVLGSAAPLLVRFSDCKARREPLAKALIDAAMRCGAIGQRDDPLPAHVLIVEDFDPNKTRVADAVLDEVLQSKAIVKIIGCKQGDEDELVNKIRAANVQHRLLFLGRMKRADVVQLAERLDPGRGEHLADEALRILDAEGLKRTPLTVTLLLSLLLRNNAHGATSQTSMIDAYLALMLGAGDPHDDGTGLTDQDLQGVLSKIAAWMVENEQASLPESEMVKLIQETLDRFGWNETRPSDVLNLLVRRRILRRHGANVEFARYAYFTLFAARRATDDVEFREKIANDIFYYMPVVTRVAALVRTDADLLARLEPLLQEELAEPTATGSPYELVPVREVDEMPKEHASAPAAEPSDLDPDEIEFPESDSLGSFGLVKKEMPDTARLQRTLRLASSVLRDLDQVEQLDLKRKLLVTTLELWGRLIAALGADSALSELKESIARNLQHDEPGTDGKESEEWVEFLARSFPAATVLAGMEATLTSPKLAGTLDAAFRAGEIKSDEQITASLFLYFLMRPSGWASRARELVDQAQPTWVLTYLFQALCEDAFSRGGMPESELLDLCKAIYVKDRTFANPGIRSAHLDAYAGILRNRRQRNRLSPYAPPAPEW